MDALSIGLAVISLFSAGLAAYSLYGTVQERKRETVADVWASLISTDAMAARRVIGHSARTEELAPEDKDDFVDAAFRLLWELQRIDMAIAMLKRTRRDSTEAKWLLRQVDVIYPDLRNAIFKHGAGFDWQPTLKYTNEVLENITAKMKGPEKERAYAPIEVPSPAQNKTQVLPHLAE